MKEEPLQRTSQIYKGSCKNTVKHYTTKFDNLGGRDGQVIRNIDNHAEQEKS